MLHFVVAPAGNLRKYVANSGKFDDDPIRSDMPVDSRIAIHTQLVNTLMFKLLKNKFPNATTQDFVNAIKNNPDSWSNTLKELEGTE